MAFKFPSVYDAYYARSQKGNNKKLIKELKLRTSQYQDALKGFENYEKEALNQINKLKNKTLSARSETNTIKLQMEENLALAGTKGYLGGISATYPYMLETRPKGLHQQGSLFPAQGTLESITEAFERSGLTEFPPGFINKNAPTPFRSGQKNETRLRWVDLPGVNLGAETRLFTDKTNNVDYHLWRQEKTNLLKIDKSQFYGSSLALGTGKTIGNLELKN